MIKEIAAKHDKWVNIALTICKDRSTAEDLVSEMYLKLLENNLLEDKESINSSYIRKTLNSIYLNQLKVKEKVRDSEKGYYEQATSTGADFEYFDVTKKDAELPNCLTWVEKQVLILRQTKSGRDIEKQYHINYQKVHRIENQAKAKLEEWARKLGASAMSLQK